MLAHAASFVFIFSMGAMMKSSFRSTLVTTTTVLALMAMTTANAAPVLLGVGSIAAASSDLSGLAGTVEDGTPTNIFGAGSAIAYTGIGNRFLVVPDRGPNAQTWNPAVDNTTSFDTRFHEIDLSVTKNGPNWTVTPTLMKTTLLTDGNGTNYTGLSSDNATRFDPEGIRVSNSGQNVFISDEYGPYIREFDRSTGELVRQITLPAKFLAATQEPTGAAELVDNTSGRQANRGMEGLAITPDGKTLVGIMQSPLIQDNGLDANLKRVGKNVRILTVDLATNTTKEFVYQLDDKGYGISEIVAINDHEFLVIERDGKGGSDAGFKKIIKIDISGATDVSAVASLPKSALPVNITPVTKSVFLDMLDPAYGLAGTSFPEKIEGISFGQDLSDGQLFHTLVITNDNDFQYGATLSDGSTQPIVDHKFFVFGFTNTDLPGYQRQNVVPEPGALALFITGLTASLFAIRRRT